MAVHSLEVTNENLLSVVVRMPEKEFERFLKDARERKKRETELIKKVRQSILTPDKEKIYRKLARKLSAETITPEEYQKLLELTDEMEELNVQRLECLGEIAKIRQEPFDKVMADLNIKPKSYE